jgi:hypothetical protein
MYSFKKSTTTSQQPLQPKLPHQSQLHAIHMPVITTTDTTQQQPQLQQRKLQQQTD